MTCVAAFGAAGGAAATAAERCLPPPLRQRRLGAAHPASSRPAPLLLPLCSLGALVYVALTPSLCELGRPDLAVGALACAACCFWPIAVGRYARAFYVRRRDLILAAQ